MAKTESFSEVLSRLRTATMDSEMSFTKTKREIEFAASVAVRRVKISLELKWRDGILMRFYDFEFWGGLMEKKMEGRQGTLLRGL